MLSSHTLTQKFKSLIGHTPTPSADRHTVITDNPYFKDKTNTIIVNQISAQHENNAMVDTLFQQRSKSIHPHWLAAKKWRVYEILSPRFMAPEWLIPKPIDQVAKSIAKALDEHQAGANTSVPRLFDSCTITLDGREIPGYIIEHHLAHQCSSYYTSPQNSALILSHDGGTGIESGFISVAKQGQLFPLGPHLLEIGQLYDFVAAKLGLGALGGAGKLMGLASYGQGRIPEAALPSCYGNRQDWLDFLSHQSQEIPDHASLYDSLFNRLRQAAKNEGLDISVIGDAKKVLEPAPREIAFSIQRFTENTLLDFVTRIATYSKTDLKTFDLCFTGGVALNCPTNTKLHASGLFRHVHIEPHCEDGGLAIGAGFFFASHLHDKPPAITSTQSAHALLGPKVTHSPHPSWQDLFDEFKPHINVEPCENIAGHAATDLVNNHIIAYCLGHSEIGPRALGARSIICNPAHADNWQRCNHIKQRELWRPFAPALLQQDLTTYFSAGPSSSPFMLFTYHVKDAKKSLYPAIVHVDGTSRVQTVTQGDTFYDLLLETKKHGLDIILNTSFNGRATHYPGSQGCHQLLTRYRPKCALPARIPPDQG